MTAEIVLPVESLDAGNFAEFGVVLGDGPSFAPETIAFSDQTTDFWSVHAFDPGAGGAPEVLWVNYRNDSLQVRALEVHWLTEQAIVPLMGGDLLHVVAPTCADGRRIPDLSRLRCFRVTGGRGICMRPGCWHASFVTWGETTCLMLTRRSTTRDLVAHLKEGTPAAETAVVRLDERCIRIRPA